MSLRNAKESRIFLKNKNKNTLEYNNNRTNTQIAIAKVVQETREDRNIMRILLKLMPYKYIYITIIKQKKRKTTS